jgi:hypothetical protein
MKKRKTNLGRMTETDILSIIESVGVRAASRKLGIPKSTLGDLKTRSSVQPPARIQYRPPVDGPTPVGRPKKHREPKTVKGNRLVVIPDAHAHPEYDNERFKILGRFINDVQPDYVVCIGDFADMPSLSSYDRGTRGFEGRRYQRDISSHLDAQDKMFSEISEETRDQAEWIYTLGNHEDRIGRVTNAHPELHGTIGIKDLRLPEHGWQVHPFLAPVSVEGIAFAHYFASGVAGRPISGVNIGSTLCTKLHMSAVQGHSHIYSHAESTRPDGQKIFGMSVGCYTHPEMVEGWNMSSHQLWWRGVIMLDSLDGQGYYDEISALTMRGMFREYA